MCSSPQNSEPQSLIINSCFLLAYNTGTHTLTLTIIFFCMLFQNTNNVKALITTAWDQLHETKQMNVRDCCFHSCSNLALFIVKNSIVTSRRSQ